MCLQARLNSCSAALQLLQGLKRRCFPRLELEPRGLCPFQYMQSILVLHMRIVHLHCRFNTPVCAADSFD